MCSGKSNQTFAGELDSCDVSEATALAPSLAPAPEAFRDYGAELPLVEGTG